MSFISRLWNTIRNPVRYVGRDLEGNKFYESRSPNDPSRPKRTVQYYDPEDMWKYIGGGKRLAIQWSAWLTHTRPQPPTIEELQVDMNRQQRVLANVALIEARDRAESEEMLRIRQEDTHTALEEAATRAQGLQSQSMPEPASSSNISAPTEAATAQATTQISTQTFSSSPKPTQTTPKVLPPKFLTPTTPRKSPPLSHSNFAMSAAEISDRVSSQPQQAEAGTIPGQERLEQTSTPPPPIMNPRPASETESWTPKARRRG
ncbi:hypothetical protein GALMADRAFT_1179861 [Galerina marginata CBS 339.88]|uniref:NADH dehydrogenase [ubiquinone] 1 alpha subcomplex subunit n=1 Tax=Galerina marginata (strain CBS 339.88) TaxID=685588 RepID=A0A067TMC3_GALM3|nr:hypothetical protein GALMADRAFT_1179861 [Galerina marginata CBS 339.88]